MGRHEDNPNTGKPAPGFAPDSNERNRMSTNDNETTEAQQMLTLYTHTGRPVQYPKPKAKAKFNLSSGPGVSWAAWTHNLITGCLHGCPYCYARAIATSSRFAAAFPAGFEPLFHPERLQAPANTKIPAKHQDDPAWRRVFVGSMADMYGRWVPQEWLTAIHESLCAHPQWQYILLTKFPSRYGTLQLPPAAWVGTSVDTQDRVRIAQKAMGELPSGVIKWLSLEPLLEPLRFDDLSMFDWIVIGAQTATNQPGGRVEAFAPPFEWVARIVAQAREAGCRVHLKPNLLGATGPTSPGMTLPNEFPETVGELSA
ncbi:bacteriophage protein gp37 [Mycobacteroides abscessus subsp. abscessus]|nr:bacteriophage protein gp37 [Mycobacteroides abscessus subsp. abscessus]